MNRYLLIDGLLWLYWTVVRKVVQRLPVNVFYSLLGIIDYVSAHFFLFKRKDIERLLSQVFLYKYSKEEIALIAKRSISQSMKRYVEELYMGVLTKETMSHIVEYENLHNLEKSIKHGKGTIVLLSHFGSYLMILPALGFSGYKINQLAGPPFIKKQRWIYRKIFYLRQQDYSGLPVRFLRSDLHLKETLKALKDNELVAIAFDGRESAQWVEVSFFDKRAYFAPGPVKLAQKTGAAILPTFIIRKGDNTHTIVFEEPIYLNKSAASDNNGYLEEHMQRLAGIFEYYIGKYPCHFAAIMQTIEARYDKAIVDRPLFKRNN
ncbi:MAG: lysophospholipid acyltransferase family protein [Candidatus Magnetoovum sp. WYHC-5]|nr:lysophospholipid acyltransferase family protein [Candidatus Magnetoovum sp. WYHC-5]